jgi:hypothetical protein
MVSGGSSTAGQVVETGDPEIYDGDKLYIPKRTSTTTNPKEIVAMVLFQGMVSVVMGAIEVSMDRNLGGLKAASVATMQGDKINRSRKLHLNTGIYVVIPQAPPVPGPEKQDPGLKEGDGVVHSKSRIYPVVLKQTM